MDVVKARFDGRVFVPETPVDLPVGYTLQIPIPREPEVSPKPLAELIEQLESLPENPNWPADGAQQHDHYLYGTPKK